MTARQPSRRATPRRLRVLGWVLERRRAWRPQKARPPADVVLIDFDGEWEHGQRQRVRVELPSTDLPGLIDALNVAASEPAADVQEPSPPPSGDAPGPGPGTPPAGGRPGPSSPRRDNRHAVRAVLDQRLDRRFGDRPSRAAFVSPYLRREGAGDLDELPIAVLAEMANALAARSS